MTFEAVIELIVVVVDIFKVGEALRRWFQRDEIVGFCLRKILKDGRISSSRKRCSFEIFKRGAKECHVACCTIERSWMKSTGMLAIDLAEMNRGGPSAQGQATRHARLTGSIPGYRFHGETLNNCKADFPGYH